MLFCLIATPVLAQQEKAQQEKAQQECTADAVLQTVQSQIQPYMDNNDVAKLTGKGSSQYIQNTFVCERNWETTDAEGRAVYTITHNPESLSLQRVYKLLHAKTEPRAAPPPSNAAISGSDRYDAICEQGRGMAKVAADKSAHTVYAYQMVVGKVLWPQTTAINGRPSPHDTAVTLCVSKLAIDWPPANFGIGKSYAKRDWLVSYAVTSFPNGSFAVGDFGLN